ncbi:hypothetical protein AB833_30465 [Chromatiales bacterium (ex Bugula neritina AB1)]|nr:hypothetical protein AB833_30465 [Chromatiales bacterium (ex Bugula neritina AB1)]
MTEAAGNTPESTTAADGIPEQWSHISSLRPQLQQHVSAHPQDFRGVRWYILSDSARGRHLRFNEIAYEFIGRLDGDQTVEEIYQQLETSADYQALSRHDIVTILTQLFAVEVLRSGLPTDVEQMFKRSQAEKQANRIKRWMNPLAIRFPLFDPDVFLNRAIPTIRPVFSLAGAVLWFLVIMIAGMFLLIHYQELAFALKQDILSPRNIFLVIALFPIMKTFHEFAHSFTVKAWGGEVHEMGITLLVLMPVPYVDASAAWAFREKYKRILVSASGMIMELFLAALAFIIWTLVQPGLIKDAALSAFLIGSVSTILFNANPLLRFDGYYILQDWIEIPNLYSRSSRYNIYLLKKILLGQNNAVSPVTDPGEIKWFIGYGILAWMYRLFITFVIAVFLASKFLVLGVILAVWSMVLLFVVPVYRGIRYLLFNDALTGIRTRALSRIGGLAMLMLATISIIPFSLYTNAEGIVWVPDQAQLYAKTDGFVQTLSIPAGTQVKPDTTVLQLDNPDLHTRKLVLNAKYRELYDRHKSERFTDPVKAEQTKVELITVEADIHSLQLELESQTLISRSSGTLVFPGEQNLVGRYVEKGQAVAYVVDPDQLIVRLVVPQAAVGLLSKEIRNVEVRLADRVSKVLDATVIRQTPSGSNSLPSRALGAGGGGDIAVVGSDTNGTTTAEKVFQIDLELPDNSDVAGLGTRAFVRINHGREILASQWLRKTRQLLLNTLPFLM